MTALAWSHALRRHPTARRLGLSFDPDQLASDLQRFDDKWWHRHAGPYHDGAWESVSLWSPRGDPFEQRSFGGAFAATPALALAPAIRKVLDRFPCERNRVRLNCPGPKQTASSCKAVLCSARGPTGSRCPPLTAI